MLTEQLFDMDYKGTPFVALLTPKDPCEADTRWVAHSSMWAACKGGCKAA